MMREDNQLAVQPKQFVVTTNSSYTWEVYLNLAHRIKVTSTYIRLNAEFVYFAVILNSSHAKLRGWALDRTLATRLTVEAVEQAIGKRCTEPGLVDHSDRGFQYASAEYVAIMDTHRMVPSISRPACATIVFLTISV